MSRHIKNIKFKNYKVIDKHQLLPDKLKSNIKHSGLLLLGMAALCLIILAAGKTSLVSAGSMKIVYERTGMMGMMGFTLAFFLMMFIFAFMGFLVISATSSKIKKGFNSSPATNEAVADLFFNLKEIGAEITVRDAHSAQTDGVWRVGHIHTAHKAILEHREYLKDVDAKEIVKNWYLS